MLKEIGLINLNMSFESMNESKRIGRLSLLLLLFTDITLQKVLQEDTR